MPLWSCCNNTQGEGGQISERSRLWKATKILGSYENVTLNKLNVFILSISLLILIYLHNQLNLSGGPIAGTHSHTPVSPLMPLPWRQIASPGWLRPLGLSSATPPFAAVSPQQCLFNKLLARRETTLFNTQMRRQKGAFSYPRVGGEGGRGADTQRLHTEPFVAEDF